MRLLRLFTFRGDRVVNGSARRVRLWFSMDHVFDFLIVAPKLLNLVHNLVQRISLFFSCPHKALLLLLGRLVVDLNHISGLIAHDRRYRAQRLHQECTFEFCSAPIRHIRPRTQPARRVICKCNILLVLRWLLGGLESRILHWAHIQSVIRKKVAVARCQLRAWPADWVSCRVRIGGFLAGARSEYGGEKAFRRSFVFVFQV